MRLIVDTNGLLGVKELGCGWFELPNLKPFFFCLDQALECINCLTEVPIEKRLAVCRQLGLVGLKPLVLEVVNALDVIPVASLEEMEGISIEIRYFDQLKSLMPYGLIRGNQNLTGVEIWSLEIALGVLHQSAQSDMIGLNFMQARRLFSKLRSANVPRDRKEWNQRLAKLNPTEQSIVRQIRR